MKNLKGFNTVNGRCCCNNLQRGPTSWYLLRTRFNTASGRYYCNLTQQLEKLSLSPSSFNTVNGKYYFLITFVLPSLCLGTWDMRTSSSLCSSAVSHPSAHTVNGRCCCNWLLIIYYLIILFCFNTVNGRCCCNNNIQYYYLGNIMKVSIPQAISTIAMGRYTQEYGIDPFKTFQYRKR